VRYQLIRGAVNIGKEVYMVAESMVCLFAKKERVLIAFIAYNQRIRNISSHFSEIGGAKTLKFPAELAAEGID
jgi:hypothetical protein